MRALDSNTFSAPRRGRTTWSLLVLRLLPSAGAWRLSLLNLLAAVAAGGAVVAAAARALRMPELRRALGRA